MSKKEIIKKLEESEDWDKARDVSNPEEIDMKFEESLSRLSSDFIYLTREEKGYLKRFLNGEEDGDKRTVIQWVRTIVKKRRNEGM